MAEIPRQILVEKENIEEVLRNLNTVILKKERSFIELAAIATCLHNFYNGTENILKQALSFADVKVARTETWHKDLLKLSAANNIISESLQDDLYELLSFRHFFVHSYGFMLEKNQLETLAEKIPVVWKRFSSEILRYFQSR